MEKRTLSVLAAALGIAFLSASVSLGALAVPGDFQNEAGFGNDWTPETAGLMTDLGGGLHELAVTISPPPATPLTRFQFKVLDDGGTPPASWSDPEIPNNGGGSPNNWFVTNAAGSATIKVDRNTYSDGFVPAKDRITISTDTTAFTNFYATGSWMSEAGGVDWAAGNPAFAMTNAGGNLWSVDAVISTPGSYEFKATANGTFDFQWGANGRNTNASNFPFTTVAVNQEVTFLLDVGKGAISYSTETFLLGDTDTDGTIELSDFYPIRDNWLNETFLRALGNLDNTGASQGVVDITDFRQWKNACTLAGCTSGAGMASALASLGLPVPEPGCLTLTLVAAIGWLAGARKR